MVKHPARVAGCTKRQIEAFERIAIGQWQGVAPRTLKALAAKGLIGFEVQRVGADALGPIEINVPYVPLGRHYQWCEWCATQPHEGDPHFRETVSR
jgi:hypothetical protein